MKARTWSGRIYSHLSVGDPPSGWMPAIIGLALTGGSYVAYRLKPSRGDTFRDRLVTSDRAAGAGPAGLRT
jgi:hypothetical protein